jgi:2,4-dienoyl-CoA reductase-like NADH-dependent reductase (Old Yellow Enzyme family)
MKLLEQANLGNMVLKNSMAMAPMTRSRAGMDGVVGDSTVLYYRQRASAGLIISEAINISKQATGSPLTPGIYTQDQINAWKKLPGLYMKKEGSYMHNFGIQGGWDTRLSSMENNRFRLQLWAFKDSSISRWKG